MGDQQRIFGDGNLEYDFGDDSDHENVQEPIKKKWRSIFSDVVKPSTQEAAGESEPKSIAPKLFQDRKHGLQVIPVMIKRLLSGQPVVVKAAKDFFTDGHFAPCVMSAFSTDFDTYLRKKVKLPVFKSVTAIEFLEEEFDKNPVTDIEHAALYWTMGVLMAHSLVLRQNWTANAFLKRLEAVAAIAKFAIPSEVKIAIQLLDMEFYKDAASSTRVARMQAQMVEFLINPEAQVKVYNTPVRAAIFNQASLIARYSGLMLTRLCDVLKAAGTNVFSVPDVTIEFGLFMKRFNKLIERYGEYAPYAKILELPGVDYLSPTYYKSLHYACVAYANSLPNQTKIASSNTLPPNKALIDKTLKEPAAMGVIKVSMNEGLKAGIECLGYDPFVKNEGTKGDPEKIARIMKELIDSGIFE